MSADLAPRRGAQLTGVALLSLLLTGCATTSELIARGELEQACRRKDDVFLSWLVNQPPWFEVRTRGDVLVLTEGVVPGDTRRSGGPRLPGWQEVRSRQRAWALAQGLPPPADERRKSRSSLATAAAVVGTVTGVLPAASVLLKRDLVTPALSGPDEPAEWEPPPALELEGRRVRVYERVSEAGLGLKQVELDVQWAFGVGEGACRREAEVSWPLGASLDATLRGPAQPLRCVHGRCG